MSESIKIKLLNFIKNSKDGVTISDITKYAKLERHTITKYLESLLSQNLISFREVGRTKLWSINKSPILALLNSNNETGESFKNLLKDMNQNISFISKDKKVIWADKLSVGRTCTDKLQDKSICKQCPIEKADKSGKKETIKVHNAHLSIIPIKDVHGKTIAYMELVK